MQTATCFTSGPTLYENGPPTGDPFMPALNYSRSRLSCASLAWMVPAALPVTGGGGGRSTAARRCLRRQEAPTALYEFLLGDFQHLLQNGEVRRRRAVKGCLREILVLTNRIEAAPDNAQAHFVIPFAEVGWRLNLSDRLPQRRYLLRQLAQRPLLLGSQCVSFMIV